jgi:hypothetical protein
MGMNDLRSLARKPPIELSPAARIRKAMTHVQTEESNASRS